ncbi:hypothetical protein BDL97_10G068000 [Sphagnum fallax]|nr:hypothetical protein BDL97_10G068000 [Sphagnum fallax]
MAMHEVDQCVLLPDNISFTGSVSSTNKFVQNNNLIQQCEVDEKKHLFVQDIVTFQDEVLLFIRSCKGAFLPRKEDYECIFGGTQKTKIHAIGFKEPELIYVKCLHPKDTISLHVAQNQLVSLLHTKSQYQLETMAQYPKRPSWESLVYEALVRKGGILLFVQGYHDGQSKGFDLSQMSQFNTTYVVQCEMPHPSLYKSLIGKKISIKLPKMGLLPSIKYFICACSMIQNQARFLKEWIMYHSYLGIERWYLYDNNSVDEFEEVLNESLLQFNVTHHIWPWRNVEETCMSHCALRAQHECEWVMFTHVDEFLYPINYIYGNKKAMYNNYSILERFIKMETERVWGAKGANHVAEIRLHCFDYGPSGLTQPPEEGVMVGYTCRMKTAKRHKSIVRMDALSDSLLNVVHHFSIKPKFRTLTLHQNIAVINHYKYQVWDVFKSKLRRSKMGTYIIIDPKVEHIEGVEDLRTRFGIGPIEPLDWPDRFCQLVDFGLHNFTLHTFQHPHTHQLLWQ